jgi:hypothetical protein
MMASPDDTAGTIASAAYERAIRALLEAADQQSNISQGTMTDEPGRTSAAKSGFRLSPE